ncbi:hypothetical protein GEMRC1_007367 [Eukaryota sp. GEM-RC1]
MLKPESEDEDSQLLIDDERHLEAILLFSLYWSVGAVLMNSERAEFDTFVKELSGLSVAQCGVGGCPSGSLPGGQPTVFDYLFDTSLFQWLPWKSRVEGYTAPSPFKFSKIVVPTVDTVRNTWLLDTMVKNKFPVLFVGFSGTGKTVTIQNYLSNPAICPPQYYSSLQMNFSSRTTSLDVQSLLEENVDKRSAALLVHPKESNCCFSLMTSTCLLLISMELNNQLL